MADSSQAQPDASLRVEELAALVRQQAEAIQDLKTHLSKQIKREIANTNQRLEAHQALQVLIGDLPAPLHGWPISPDFALQLVRLIPDHSYDLIIEFGSGTSTLLCLRILEQFNLYSADQAASPHRLITFEHLNTYHQKTTDLVDTCSNRPLLDLRLSPLEPWEDATGSYSYYAGTAAIGEAIQAVASSVGRPLKLLVVIDGPPGATCHWARYPAVPIVLDAASCTDVSIDFLLDDVIRADEKEMTLAWEQQLQAFGVHYQRVDYNFEKGCLLLSVNSLAGIDTSQARSQALATEKQEQDVIAAAIARVDELLTELAAAKQAAANEKAAAQQSATDLKDQLSAQTAKVKSLKAELAAQGEELAALTVERDGVVQEKAASLQSATELKEQLVAQAEALQEVQTARDAEAARAESLGEELAALKKQEQEAIEEAELTLLQLHQVQEELEHYFLNAQSAEQLAAAQQDQLLRAQALMARVLPEAVAQPLVQGLEVEVLPPLTPAAGVQTEALLSSYASSLHRAASLLQRAMQR